MSSVRIRLSTLRHHEKASSTKEEAFFIITTCQSIARTTLLPDHENTKTKAQKPRSQSTAGLFVIHDIMWSWWESNPRPHKETICFLHAYSGLRFSSCDKTRTTNRSLSSKIFIPQPELPRNYFRFNLRRFAFGFGTTSSERRLVLLPCKRIKLVIYCASIKQREHTCCCQLIVRQPGFRSRQPTLRVLTYHFISPSNPVNPKMIFFLMYVTIARQR